MELFSITCTTCRARLKVRDVAAIGQILSCPKCGSMVQVLAPAGWQPPVIDAKTSGEASSSAPVLSGSSSSQLSGLQRWKDEVTAEEKREPTATGSMASAPAPSAKPKAEGAAPKRAAWRDPMPPNEPRELAEPAPTDSLWFKWTLFAGLPALALLAASGLWIWSSHRSAPEQAPVAEAKSIEAPPSEAPAAPTSIEAEEPEPIAWDGRWIPPATKALVSLRFSRLYEHPTGQAVFYHLASIWSPVVVPLFAQFELAPQQVARLTWTTVDVNRVAGGDWIAAGVAVIELDPQQARDWQMPEGGQTLDWKMGDALVYASASPDWPHPFSRVDEFTIVTGPESVLKELGDRTEPGLENADLQRLLDQSDFEQLAVGVVDLAALRQAEALPEWAPLVEVWRVGRDDWQILRQSPRAAGCEIGLAKLLNLQLRLACETETDAEQTLAALNRVLGAMAKTTEGEVDALTEKLLSGQITTADASRFKRLLSAGREALEARESGVEKQVVWARTPWKGDLPSLAVAALAAIPDLETSRLAAARPLDEQNQRRLLQGLIGYEKAEGALPFGAADASLLPPETRLSWIATLLPYYDRLDWHGELNFSRFWNEADNSRVTRRPLELTINPALGPGTTTAGFPVTHYVGLAGVGPGAATLEISDPHAGVFGYRRQASLAEMSDGASNSLALMGVSSNLGAWAAGGEATVRALTKQPYINGPDGFGSGQPDGMLVGMADGSTRFLSKDIDPSVLEALATINGGEKALQLPGGPRLIAKSEEPASEMPDEPDAEPEIQAARPGRNGPAVDVNARLNDPLPAIKFANTPLSDVIQVLSQLSTAPINLDLEALAQAGVKPDKKIDLQLTDTTIGDALSAAIEDLGLIYVVVDGQVLITSAARREQKLERFSFDAGDLMSNQAGEDLAELVQRFVEPTSWQEAGGQGAIKREGKRLVGQQTKEVARQVGLFLDKLRFARGKPTVEGRSRPRSLASRYSSAKNLLTTPVTANYRQPTPLAEIVEHLRSSAKADFVFDGLALSTAGLSDRSDAQLVVENRPLADALKTMLEPLRLSFRVAENGAIVVTTIEAAREQMEVEFYAAAPLVNEGQNAEALVERIKSELAPRSWRDAGGAGDLQFDADSSCLIVLQTQALQVELEQLLETWRPKRAAAD